jgi:hypothetical protein
MIKIKKIITILIFLILLGLRISDRSLPIFIFGTSEIPSTYSYLYISITFGLSSIVIWINSRDLEHLNIDSSFIYVFLSSGILLSLLYLPISMGLITGLFALTTFLVWRGSGINYKNNPLNYRELLIFFLVGSIPIIINYIVAFDSAFRVDRIANHSILLAAYDSSLHLVVFEEILYRGILWMLLKDMNLDSIQIIIIQAVLFWLSHYYYFNKPIVFWIYIPLVSILYGLVVWRSKTLAPSTVMHYLYNVLIRFLQQGG